MRRKRAEKPENIDDGRVIASMNVDGMPWYSPGKTRDATDADTSDDNTTVAPIEMTRRESIAFTFGILKAVLLVTLVFLGSLFLFIIFCINIWFA